ncbi:MAG: hypothetical protein ACRYE8_05290 [Janthinobacterium lividum]
MSYRGGIVAWIIFPCHPVIYSRDPVKNTNKISIFWIATLISFARNDELYKNSLLN